MLTHRTLYRYLRLIEGDGDGAGGGNDEPKFTQADLDRVAGRARSEGRTAAATELAEQLGCSVDDAKAIIEAQRTADQAALSDAQRAKAEADQAKAEAQRAKAEAAAERLAAKVERKLIAAGVGVGIPDDNDGKKAAAILARATRLVNLAPDADDDAIQAEIDAVKADVPSLFTPTGAAPAPGTPPAPKPPKAPSAPGGGTPTLADLGTETLATAGIRPRSDAAA